MSPKHSDTLLSGALAAFTVDLLIYPLDTLKTRIQSPDYTRLYLDPATKAVNRAQLFRGLYQGVGSVIVVTLPASGIFFTTYEFTKSRLSSPIAPAKLPQPLIHAASSSLAELLSCALLTPFEVLKQNAQMVQSESQSQSPSRQGAGGSPTLQTLRRFRANPAGLWRGYTALAARNLPFTALQFPVFEKLKIVLGDWRRRRRRQHQRRGVGGGGDTMLQTATTTAMAAAVAGSFAAWITTPVDVVKTRIMLSAAGGGSGGEGKSPHLAAEVAGQQRADKSPPPTKRKSGLAIAREIWRTEGARGLWKGGALRGVWTAAGSGLYLGVYETGRVWLGSRREGGRRRDEAI